MEFVTGIQKREEAELEDLLQSEEGSRLILEGAVHSVRDMGDIAFVILRKRDGLIQTVWEEGKKRSNSPRFGSGCRTAKITSA